MRFPVRAIRSLCRAFALLGLLVTLTASSVHAQPTPSQLASQAKLRAEMASIAAVTRGPMGAAVLVVEGGSVVALHGEQRFPMQSVYKLPIAMALLHQADLGTLSLNQRIQITPADFPRPPEAAPFGTTTRTARR